jgi:hypothetical protein
MWRLVVLAVLVLAAVPVGVVLVPVLLLLLPLLLDAVVAVAMRSLQWT